jgi:hypothetical protein
MTKPTNHPQWLRSSRCGNDSCVEVAREGERVLLRDSKNPETAPLEFTISEWVAFIGGAQNGEFDFA